MFIVCKYIQLMLSHWNVETSTCITKRLSMLCISHNMIMNQLCNIECEYNKQVTHRVQQLHLTIIFTTSVHLSLVVLAISQQAWLFLAYVYRWSFSHAIVYKYFTQQFLYTLKSRFCKSFEIITATITFPNERIRSCHYLLSTSLLS